VLAPADEVEVRGALEAALKSDNPAYIRIGKKGEPVVHKNPRQEFAIGKGIVLREARKFASFRAGTILPVALAAAELLAQKGHSTRVVSFHTSNRWTGNFWRKCLAGFALSEPWRNSVLEGWAAAWRNGPRNFRQARQRLVRFWDGG